MKKLLLVLALVAGTSNHTMHAAEGMKERILRPRVQDMLYSALRDNNLEQAKNLLATRLVNASTLLRDELGQPVIPMHLAAQAGNIEMMSLLLENGARLHERAPSGVTVRIIMEEHNSPELMRAFATLQRRADELDAIEASRIKQNDA